jgi:hypothetical protein
MQKSLIPGVETASRPKYDGRIKKFLQYWHELWFRRFGDAWIDSSPVKHRHLVKKLLVSLDQRGDGLSLLKTAAERLFEGRLKWVSAPSVGVLSTHINELLVEPKDRQSDRRTDWNKIAKEHGS